MTTDQEEQEFLKRLEPNLVDLDPDISRASIAVSLKRIADAQQIMVDILRKETYRGGGGAGGPI